MTPAGPAVKPAGQSNPADPMRLVGRVATLTAMAMYVAYIPQIVGNLQGSHSSPVQPAVAGVNCCLWVLYGLFEKHRDLPVAIANAPGVVFGVVAALTAI